MTDPLAIAAKIVLAVILILVGLLWARVQVWMPAPDNDPVLGWWWPVFVGPGLGAAIAGIGVFLLIF